MSIAQAPLAGSASGEAMKRYMPWLFFAVMFGQGFGPLLVLQYLSFYVSDYMGMSLVTLGIVLTGCNVSDWAFTLITGTIVQRTNTRWGQYRPWIFFSPILIFVCYVTIFSGFVASELVNIIVIAACYGISGFGWQTLQLSNNGILTKVAGADGATRLLLSARMQMGTRFAGIFTAMITAPLIQYSTEHGFNGYRLMAIGYGFVYLIPNITMFFLSKKYDQFDPDFKAPTAGGSVKVWELWKTTFTNPHFLIIFLAGITISVDDNMVAPLNTYFFRYSIGNFSLLAVSGTISLFIASIAATLMRPVAQKLGKRNSALISFAIGVFLNIGIAFLTHQNFVAKVVLVSCLQVQFILFTIWGINLYLDAAEYQEWKTGKDMKAFVMSMNNMVPRIASVFGAPFSAIVLSQSGYNPATQTMANPEIMTMFIGLLPAFTYACGFLIYLFGYKMTEEKAQEYADFNKKRREERIAAALAAGETIEPEPELVFEDD